MYDPSIKGVPYRSSRLHQEVNNSRIENNDPHEKA